MTNTEQPALIGDPKVTDQNVKRTIDWMIESGYTIVPPGDLPDGIWLVVNQDGTRSEMPIKIPELDLAEVHAATAAIIRSMDSAALWQEALAGADMMKDPAALLLEAIASFFDPPEGG